MSNGEKFFKLGKNGKDLESAEYSSCLKRYFNYSWSLIKLTIPDLKNILDGIQSVMFGLSLPTTNAFESFFFCKRACCCYSGLIKVKPGIRYCSKM